MRQTGLSGFEDREVGFAVDAYDLGSPQPSLWLENGLPVRLFIGARGQHDLYSAGAGDDVCVGDDVSLRIDEHSRARAFPSGEQSGARYQAPTGNVGGGEDLNHGWVDARCQSFEGLANLLERIGDLFLR